MSRRTVRSSGHIYKLCTFKHCKHSGNSALLIIAFTSLCAAVCSWQHCTKASLQGIAQLCPYSLKSVRCIIYKSVRWHQVQHARFTNSYGFILSQPFRLQVTASLYEASTIRIPKTVRAVQTGDMVQALVTAFYCHRCRQDLVHTFFSSSDFCKYSYALKQTAP
jgi:hypothetical protein